MAYKEGQQIDTLPSQMYGMNNGVPTKIAVNSDGKVEVNIDLSVYEKLAIPITTAELSAAISASTLIAGQWYLITDYQHIDTIRETSPTEYTQGNLEQIFLWAETTNTFNKVGYSLSNTGETVIIKPRNLSLSGSYSGGTPSGFIVIGIESDTELTVTMPFSFTYTQSNLTLNITDNDTGGSITLNSENYGTYWTISGNTITLSTNTFPVLTAGYVEYTTSGGNAGSQEVSVDQGVITLTTPFTDADSLERDTSFNLSDNDNGYSAYLDTANKGIVWHTDGSDIIVDLPYQYGNASIYYEDGDGSDITCEILSASTFRLAEGSNYQYWFENGVEFSMYFSMYWYADEYNLSLDYSNYGTLWTMSGNVVTLLDTSHSLLDFNASGGYIEGTAYYSDLDSELDFLTDFYMDGEVYYYEDKDVYLTDDVTVNANLYFFNPIIYNRKDNNGNNIQVDTRSAKFARYSANVSAWSSATAYVYGDVVSYSNTIYFCSKPHTNITPHKTNTIYWAPVTNISSTNDGQYFLPRAGFTFTNISLATSRGLASSVSLVSGGTGYPVSTTVQLKVSGGDGKLVIDAVTNGSGVVTSVSINTAGRHYWNNGQTWHTYATQGSGCRVTVSVSNATVNVNIPANTADRKDFYFWGNSTNPGGTQYGNTILGQNDNSILNVCNRGSNTDCYNVNMRLLSSHCVTMNSLSRSNYKTINGFANLSSASLIDCGYMADTFIMDTSGFNFISSVQNSFFDTVNAIGLIFARSFCGAFSRSVVGEVAQFNGALNYANVLSVTTVSGFFEYVNIISCSYAILSDKGNSDTTYYPKCRFCNYTYINSVYIEGGHINCNGSWLADLTITGDYVDNNIKGVGRTSVLGTSYPVTLKSIETCTSPSYITQCDAIGLTLRNNVYNTNVSLFRGYHSTDLNTFYDNVHFGPVQSIFIPNANSSVYNNRFFANWISHTFGTSICNISLCKFFGDVQNNTHTQGLITNSNFFGKVGGPSAPNGNTFNSATCIVDSNIGINFQGNTFTSTGRITNGNIGTGFANNAISAVQDGLKTGNFVTANTFSSNTTNLEIRDSVTGVTFPAVTNLIYGTWKKGSSATDYTELELDGTMVAYGNAICFREETEDLTMANIVGTNITLDANEMCVIFETDTTYNDDYISFNIRIDHDWVKGARILPVLRWWQTENRTPNWLLEYRWQKTGQAKETSVTAIPWSANRFTYSSGTLNQLTDFGSITPPANYGIGDRLQIKLTRDTADDSSEFGSADSYSTDVEAYAFGLVTDVDMLGSHTQIAK